MQIRIIGRYGPFWVMCSLLSTWISMLKFVLISCYMYLTCGLQILQTMQTQSFDLSLTHRLYPSCHLQPWAMTPVRIFDHLWPFLTWTWMSVLGINGVGLFCITLLRFFETYNASCEWGFFNVKHYYTS